MINNNTIYWYVNCKWGLMEVKLSSKNQERESSATNANKKVIRIIAFVILTVMAILFAFALFLRHCEYNHRYFIFGTRIHAVKQNVYDAKYHAGALVFVGRPIPVRELEEGALISMATGGDHPLTYNNEIFMEFQEEFFGRGLHGIVTANTLELDRLPLRAGRYIGIPIMGIPGLASILVPMAENILISSLISLLIAASAITAIILAKNKKIEKEKLTFPKKPKKKK